MKLIKRAYIVITTECNNACIWCYAEDYTTIKEKITLNNFSKILDFIKEQGCTDIIITGGEPTSHPELSKLISIAVNKNFFVSIISNGYGIDKNFINNISKYKKSIIFNLSLEGADEYSHDKITQTKGSFKRINNAFDLLIKYNIETHAIVTLSYHNDQCLIKIGNYLKNKKVKNVFLNLAIPPINNEYNTKDYLSVYEFGSVVNMSFHSFAEKGIIVSVGPTLPLCETVDELKELIKNDIIKGRGCNIFSTETLILDFNGNIILCTHLPNLVVGNIFSIKNSDFEFFWTKTMHIKFRKKMSEYPFKKCVNCNESYVCVGGCPLHCVSKIKEYEIT